MPRGLALAGSTSERLGAAEGGVGAGVAEVPDELLAGDFYLHGGEVGAGVALGGPELLRAEGQEGEEEGEGGEGKVLDGELVVGTGGAVADCDAGEEDEVRESEEGEGDPEIEEEMGVESVAVRGGVGRQVPEAVSGRSLHGLIVEGRDTSF